MHRNIIFGSIGVDWVRSLWKNPMWLHGTNFCNNCTSSPCFAPTFMQLRNDPKSTEMLWNRLKHLFRVHRIGSVCWEKSRRDFAASTFALIAPVHPVLHRALCSYKMNPNALEHYETHQNMSLGSNGVDQVCSLQKITMWLHVTNFWINWTSSVCFATSFMQLRNDPKCTQILRNAPKHLYRVQWGGLVVFVAKNPDVTSWHELLY